MALGYTREGDNNMHLIKKEGSPRYQRDNITSYLLASKLTCGSDSLAVSVVEMEPGGVQHIHAHANEQAYYVLSGTGIMTVGEESRRVAAGDCIFIPSGAGHGLVNESGGKLIYVSAASPSFNKEECETLWPLGGGKEKDHDL